MRTARRLITSLTASLALGAGLLVAAPAASAATCSTPWGTSARTAPTMTAAHVTGVRAGRHACFDRLVVDLDGAVKGWSVRYVPQVTRDGSGAVVPLRGAARLEVLVLSPAYDADTGTATYPRKGNRPVDVRGFRTFRQVAFAGTFEGQTTLGLGVRSTLPFRTFVVPGPGAGSRLVVDVAHRR